MDTPVLSQQQLVRVEALKLAIALERSHTPAVMMYHALMFERFILTGKAE